MANKNRMIFYWIAQFFGWGLYTAFLIISMLTFSPPTPHMPKIIGLQIVIGLSGLVVSHFCRYIIKRWNWFDLPISRLIIRVLGLCVAAAIVAQILIHAAMLTILDWTSFAPIEWSKIPIYAFNVFCVFLFWTVFYFCSKYFQQARQSKIEKLQAEHAIKEAELIALKAQINPHFLFNALNNIRALILEDPMKARGMVSNLSDLLRYSIQFNQQEKVSLQDEMSIVEDYLELETVQYENRLAYRLEIAPETLTQQIPPMIIQLLVENAVKHGISQLPQGGTISIKTYLEEKDLIIEVANTGQLKATSSSGIGIKNAMERIKILFAIDPYFDLREIDGQVLAQIKMPSVS